MEHTKFLLLASYSSHFGDGLLTLSGCALPSMQPRMALPAWYSLDQDAKAPVEAMIRRYARLRCRPRRLVALLV